MTIRKQPVTYWAASDFARWALRERGPCGELGNLLTQPARHEAISLLATLLCDDLTQLTEHDSRLLHALDALENAMDGLAAAWNDFMPLLAPAGAGITDGRHMEWAEQWEDFARGLDQAHQCLFGSRAHPELRFPGLGGMLRMELKRREEAHRDKGREGKKVLHRQANRPVVGYLCIALKAILERASPGTSKEAREKRTAHRRMLLEKAAERFELMARTKAKERDLEKYKKPPDPFLDGIKKHERQALAKIREGQCDEADFKALAGSIGAFPELFRVLYKANPTHTMMELVDNDAIRSVQAAWRGRRPAGSEQGEAYYQALVRAACNEPSELGEGGSRQERRGAQA
jgi:hypothetical protein